MLSWRSRFTLKVNGKKLAGISLYAKRRDIQFDARQQSVYQNMHSFPRSCTMMNRDIIKND